MMNDGAIQARVYFRTTFRSRSVGCAKLAKGAKSAK